MAEPDQAIERGALAAKGIGAGGGLSEPLDQVRAGHSALLGSRLDGWTGGMAGIAEGGV